jgi:hypothetical protein
MSSTSLGSWGWRSFEVRITQGVQRVFGTSIQEFLERVGPRSVDTAVAMMSRLAADVQPQNRSGEYAFPWGKAPVFLGHLTRIPTRGHRPSRELAVRW